MFDTVVRGTRVVTPGDVGAFDIGIVGERIACLAAHGSLSDAGRLIDAGDAVVMPGGIDPHVHCAWPMPVLDGPPGFTAPPRVVSCAALHGGTTTMIDFARWTHGNTIQDTIEARDGDWAGACCCDYSYHVMVEGALPPDLPAQLGEAIEAGYPTVKIFTTDITPSRRGRMVGFGDIWEVFQVLAQKGGLGVIHAEDNDIVMHMYAKLFREGRTGFEHMAEVHNALSEDLSFRRVIRLAEQVGTALYMMHISAGTGVEAVRAARSRRHPIYGETLHQYMLYGSADYRRPNGQIYHTYPSLKSPADQAALWAGTEDGSISAIATDEICCTLAQKVQGIRIDDTTGGNAGCEPRVALMFTEMVGKRGVTLQRFVDLVSTNAARIMGLYPRKGALAPGSDADLTILDPALARTLRAADLHETDYSPWEGWAVDAWPRVVMLRGKVVVEDGAFHGVEADGQYLHRKIAGEIVAGPAL